MPPYMLHSKFTTHTEEQETEMAHHHIHALFLSFIAIASSVATLSEGTKSFTIVNKCKETVWPGITHGENFNGSGFTLKPGQSAVYTAPGNWSGRIWGRTGCSFDQNGNGTCNTGSCGTSMNCTEPGTPPTTIAEFTLGDPDFYDVSLVDGFNLPIVIATVNGKGNCSIAGCDGDLRQTCLSELAVKSNDKVVACRSACDVFNTDEYCCRGTYGNPSTCVPTNYSMSFKKVCPAAYSYAYDDPSSVLTCSGPDYIVTFCATRNQTVCSYHDNKLICNGAGGLKAVSIFQIWRILILTFSLMFNLLAKF